MLCRSSTLRICNPEIMPKEFGLKSEFIPNLKNVRYGKKLFNFNVPKQQGTFFITC